jgi:hypothetical protein
VPAESVVRDALRAHTLAQVAGAQNTVDELWVPRSNERADMALLGRRMDGFEIKTERDTLKRLPRQVAAYGRLFDRCTVVVAEKHRDRASELVPDWWGITSVYVNGHVAFTPVRAARRNPSIDPETLVRLLWREEAVHALRTLGSEPDRHASRASLWEELLRMTTLGQLKTGVRRALLRRESATSRGSARFFTAGARATRR